MERVSSVGRGTRTGVGVGGLGLGGCGCHVTGEIKIEGFEINKYSKGVQSAIVLKK